MTVFPLSATGTVGKERGNQCKHYINPTTRCQAPPWKHRAPSAYSEISYGSRELSAHGRISWYWKEKKYRKKKWCRKVWKHIGKQTNKHMTIPYTVILLSLFSVAASSWNFSPALIRSGLHSVIQRDTKYVQGHSSQLAGIFHTIRERFNHTISVNPLKLKIMHLGLKTKVPIKEQTS